MATAEAPIMPISFRQPQTAVDAQHPALPEHISPEDELREELQRDAQRVDDQGTYMLNHLGGEDDGRTLTQSVHALDQTPLQI
jgi:hypothetical protein